MKDSPSKPLSSLLRLTAPEKTPIYNLQKTYLENLEEGPVFSYPYPEERPNSEEKYSFFGYELASPIGVAAGPLLSSEWVKVASRLGYDILTYRTIRSGPKHAYPLPNMLYLDTKASSIETKSAILSEAVPQDMESLSVGYSFGFPSVSPAFIQEDITRANQVLQKGQILIVSITGSITNKEDFYKEIIATAQIAKKGNAKIVEADLSPFSFDPAELQALTKELVQTLSPIPVLLKMGEIPSLDLLKQTLQTVATSGISGITGIAPISCTLSLPKDFPPYRMQKTTIAVGGSLCRDLALEFIEQASQIIKKEKLPLTLLGTGGITLAKHFTEFLDRGADIALTATGMTWDPYLAMKYHQLKASPHAAGPLS